MSELSRDSEHRAVQQTLLSTYCPPLIREARANQDALLARLLTGGPFKIADIGCGDGYHAAVLRDVCDVYHGFEIAPEMARLARERLQREGAQRGRIFEGDATAAALEPGFYDVVMCLYFTPGNFREPKRDLSEYTDDYLDRNPAFIAVMSHFRDAIAPGGRLLLTIYRDVPEAEAAQIDYYEHTGQRVVTPRGGRFVATAEGFWSARWTRDSALSNLTACGFDANRVTFHELNPIGWLVEVTR